MGFPAEMRPEAAAAGGRKEAALADGQLAYGPEVRQHLLRAGAALPFEFGHQVHLPQAVPANVLEQLHSNPNRTFPNASLRKPNAILQCLAGRQKELSYNVTA